MKKWFVCAIIALAVALLAEYQQVRYANERWETAMSNVKAYDAELSTTGEKNAALQLTVSQLEYFKDSVIRALNDTRKQLKIKDRNLKSLQQVKSTFTKADTILLTDTIFREKALALDTLVSDEWYSLRLGLRYPSMIAVRPEFRSVKHIIVSSRKETVNPPKKFFLLRWFQRRHMVLRVDVVEKNPYVYGESSKYVEIIR